MRLGVCGMVPGDFREIEESHLEGVRALDVTAVAFHGDGERLPEVTPSECRQVRGRIAAAGLELPQFGIGFGECLFDPDAGVRNRVLAKIERGIEVGVMLNAHATLIRTGSLNPAGSYSPARENHAPECRERLVDTLGSVARKAEAEGMTIVIETHLLTIMNSPETNAEVVAAVGSDRIRVVMDFVNHFQTLAQVFDSTSRLEQIFDVMGEIAPVGHVKDIRVDPGLVLHLNEEVPGEGELDMATALRRWHGQHPDGYMLLEHLPAEKYPRAAANVHRIAREAGVEIH